MKISKLKESLLRILLVIFFFVLSLGQLQRIQLTPQIAFYVHELILGVMTLLFFPELRPLYSNFIISIRRKKILLSFIIFFSLQTLVFQLLHFDVLSLFYIFRLVLYTQLIFLIWLAIKNTVFDKKHIYALLIGMSTLLAVFGFVQYLLFPDTRWLLAMGWDDHYYRLISTLFDPGFTGLIIAAGLVLFVKVFALKKTVAQSIVFSSFLMLAVLFTYSRATYVALAIVLLFNIVFSKQKVLSLIILCLFAIIPFLPRPTGEGVRLERTASITSRISSNQQAIQSLSRSEVIWGRGLYRNIIPAKSSLPSHAGVPDNSFIFLFVSLGIIGIALLFGSVIESRQVVLLEPFRSVILLVTVHSMFNNSLFYIWTLVLLMTLFAMNDKLRFK